MTAATARRLASFLAEEADAIVRQWLERVSERVTLDDRFLFPSEDLLDHVPLLVEGMARALVADEPISVDTPVVLKAKELGKLRFDQGFSAHQILWEYQLLGSVIMHRIEAAEIEADGPVAHRVQRRLFDALAAVQRSTMEEFLDHYERTIHEREDRLRGFNHALSHELRNEVGAIMGAAQMLQEPFVIEAEAKRSQFVAMVIENAERVEHLIQNLLELSRIESDTRRHRNVLLSHAAEETARHLRAFAAAREVEIRIPDPLPAIEVNAPVVELALTNLVANGIKYHDPTKPERWVEVRCCQPSPEGTVTVQVVDNGRGVPESERGRLFERFFRASSSGDVQGTGLGLNLVRSAVRGLGGDVWPDFSVDDRTIFCFTLPARRSDDRR